MRVLAVAILFACITPLALAQDVPDTVLNCVILPDEEVDLGSPVPGVIESINVRRSDRVHKGQVIARLESSVEKATVTLAKARAATDAEVKLRRVELSYDAQHRDRLNHLQVRQAVSSQNMDDASRVAEAAQLRVQLAEDRRREALLDRRRADAVLARKTIVSPIDGVVLQLHNGVGEYIETRPVARIARLDPLRVEVIAPLSMFGSVQEGMRIAVSPQTDPGHERIATVSAVDAVADPGSGTFGIELRLPNPGLELPAGIKCTGRLLPPAPADNGTTDFKDEPNAVAAAGAASEALQASATGAATLTESTDDALDPATDFPGACMVIGPQDDEQQARDLVAAARNLGANAELDATESDHVTGYIVVSRKEAQRRKLYALTENLLAAGIKDFAVMEHGTYTNRIALGTYNGPKSAERRRASLEELGFDAEVLPRTRLQTSWNVQVHLPGNMQKDFILAQLKRQIDVTTMQEETCEPLRAAAR